MRLISPEPRWKPQSRLTLSGLDTGTRRWLLDDGSLSQRLATLGQFSVERRDQGWQRPLPSERELLRLGCRERALVREVVLRVDGTAVVFARSVFPLQSVKGRLAHLRRLQNRSLGSVLFRQPGMRRTPFEVVNVSGDSAYLPHDLHQQQSAWCRRSRFRVASDTLMVSEVFLQSFRPWPKIQPVRRSLRGTVNAAIVLTTQ
tara:strand:+ start:137793 stop:138398 length:606 start_codon:yes stop_codon:yes gene_type:complete